MHQKRLGTIVIDGQRQTIGTHREHCVIAVL